MTRPPLFRRFAPVAVIALALAPGSVEAQPDCTATGCIRLESGPLGIRTPMLSPRDPPENLVPGGKELLRLDAQGAPVGGCYADLRRAVEAAAPFVVDPDDSFFANMTLAYSPPCRVCDLKRAIEATERLQEAARKIRDVLGRCP